MMRVSQPSEWGLRSGVALHSALRLARPGSVVLGALLLGAALYPAGLRAQQDTARTAPQPDTGWSTWAPARAPRAAQQPRDFLLVEPRGSFTLRFGALVPRAGSDVFTESFQNYTLHRSDFISPSVAADVAFRLSPRLDATVSLSYAHSATHRSEYQHYYDNNNLPIEQRTHLIEVPLTVGLKAYLLPRGRQIGHFVWLPAAVQPYVGVSGGYVWHRFQQAGDFIVLSNPNLPIFNDQLTSAGWSPVVHVLAGSEFTLTRHAALQVQARYGWSSADMGPQFSGYNNLDLAGLQTTVGISWRY